MTISPLAEISSNGMVRCREHKIDAAIRTSQTASNPGRLFFRCPAFECKLFVWKDEVDARSAPEPSPVQSSPPSHPPILPSTPSRPRLPLYPSLSSPTSPEAASTSVPGHWPSSPSKRNRITPPDDDDSTIDESVIRQKRQRALDSALDVGLSTGNSPVLKAVTVNRGEPSSSSSSFARSHSFTGTPMTSRHNQALQDRQTAPITPTSARAARYAQQIKDALRTPESPLRAAPSSSTLSSGPTAFGPEDRSATPTPSPTRIRVYRLSELNSDPDDRMHQDDGSASSQYYTPPGRAPRRMVEEGQREETRSEEEFWQNVGTPPRSALGTPSMGNGRGASTKGKGKAREDTEEDMEWFKDDRQPEWSQSSFVTPSPSSTQDPSGMSGDRLLSLFGELATVPQYVQRLERKLAAAEKANVSKMKRIRELENEISRLQGKI